MFPQSRESPFSQKYAQRYHFCRIANEQGKILRIQAVDINNEVFDEVAIPSKRRLAFGDTFKSEQVPVR